MTSPDHTASTQRPRTSALTPSAWAVVRLLGAAAIIAAVLGQLSVTLGNALSDPTPHGSHLPTVAANFLSFFTIESNILGALALVIAAIWALSAGRRADVEPRWLGVLIASTATYMIVTGVVYNVLLRGIELPQGQTVAWANEILHVVGPLILLAEVLFAPQRRRLGWGTLGVIVAFPIVWCAYTLIRANFIIAPATGLPYWYPYPFLNPHNFDAGYGVVALYIIGIAAAIIAIGAGVVWVSRKRGH
ncbi:hypothetical protein JOD62_001275 [Microbacterium keratanolyticum]|uniref:FAR-17a/AIG1-like protein n=1 Tax=Microbacterium keratanolyticum TaxID=67574 RepID=A0A9W6M7T0_9MICO|nr:Pr6Pr family membrane protein [Microbacterium keratanolyticum]MBM7468727.1 hypothetical protein [Microbacterium keratanolyticum]GLK00803.1 hypothetical protein GCM10017596_05180 [Microbacterium keratanolyticum]